MNCEQARQRWHGRLDADAEDVGLEDHLASCEACRCYDAQMRAILASLHELKADTDGIVDRGERRRGAADGRFAWWRMVGRSIRSARVAAVVALMVAGGLYFADHFTGVRVNPLQPSPVPARTAPAEVRLHANSARQYVAVAAPTAESDVEVFWLYPLTSTGTKDPT